MSNINDMICPCFDLTRADIIDAINEGANTVEEIGEINGAGTMCGVCLDDLEQILEEHKK